MDSQLQKLVVGAKRNIGMFNFIPRCLRGQCAVSGMLSFTWTYLRVLGDLEFVELDG
jgi:hypothetical protein